MEEKEFKTKYEGRENIQTMEEFKALFDEAINDADDYGSIVLCCALMMNAAFSLVNSSPNGGITGFQAGCLMWEMVMKYGSFEKGEPLRIVNYNDLMYPQRVRRFNTIPKDAWEQVVNNAKRVVKELEENNQGHPEVVAHMKEVAQGKVPFGLIVAED